MFDPEHEGRSVTYKYLQEKTGLSYSSVRRNVTKLADARILHKVNEGCVFVRWASQTAFERVRDWLRDFFDPKQVLNDIKERAKAKFASRTGKDDETEEIKEEPEEDVVEKDDDFIDISSGGMLDDDVRAELNVAFEEARKQMESGEWDDFGTARSMTDGGTD
jgi:hypothetical protein